MFVVTSDRDVGDSVPYVGVDVSVWSSVGNARVLYMGPGCKRLGVVAGIIYGAPRRYEVLYLNSVFDPVFSVLPLVVRRLRVRDAIPVVVAPRGEFSPGAIALKPFKKRIFLYFASRVGLFRGVTWHASGICESEDIRRVIGQAEKVVIAENIATAIAGGDVRPHRASANSGPLKIVFLSRVSRKKNLDFALGVLSKLSIAVEMNIYGPAEDQSYFAECLEMTKVMPIHVKVFWRGAIRHEDVPGVLENHDLFFLPTKGENYGHVVAEALLAGTPVLLSDATPWRNLTASGVGWDLPLSDERSFVECIEACARLSREDYFEWRKRIRRYAHRRLETSTNVEAHRNLFLDAIREKWGG
ncbi:glycosyltransferase [Methylolobus aquaticus]